jgi:hypothetical protein
MHCDRVYVILTRGPFPSGEVTDVAVEIHLAHCLDCRRLAEALRPLNRPAHESMSAEVSRLPGYRGDHPEWNALSGSSSIGVHSGDHSAGGVRRRVSQPARRLQLGRLAAGVLFGIAIGVVLTAINSSGASAERGGLVSASFGGTRDNDWAKAHVQARLLYGLNLPRECSKLDSDLFYPLASDGRITDRAAKPPSFINQCCTQCHVAGSRTRIGEAQRRKLVSSCTICHGDSPRAAW